MPDSLMSKTTDEMNGAELVKLTAVVGVTALVAPYAFLALMGGTLLAYDKAKTIVRRKFPKKDK